MSLLDLLRESLALHGTKKGCDQGACGACAVPVDGQRILSCLALAVQYEGRAVTTIEGIAADGSLHAAIGSGAVSGAKYLGGGTNLVDLMRQTIERPDAAHALHVFL